MAIEKELMRETTLTSDQLHELGQAHRRRLNDLYERATQVEQLLGEVNFAFVTVKGLPSEKGRAMFQLGAGMYIEGDVLPHTLKRTLPSGVVIGTTTEASVIDLQKRLDAIKKEMKKLGEEIEKATHDLRSVENVREIAKHARQKAAKG